MEPTPRKPKLTIKTKPGARATWLVESSDWLKGQAALGAEECALEPRHGNGGIDKPQCEPDPKYTNLSLYRYMSSSGASRTTHPLTTMSATPGTCNGDRSAQQALCTLRAIRQRFATGYEAHPEARFLSVQVALGPPDMLWITAAIEALEKALAASSTAAT